MKRKIICCLIGLVLLSGIGITVKKFGSEDNLTTIRVSEVTHSAFYAPFYVAIEEGYFKVAAAVLSNDVQVGFAGPESAIYVYNGGEEDYLVTFSGLTKRDGQFIISREEISNFTLNDLKGKEILAGRTGGMPILNFQNALKNENIDEKSIEFASLAGSFISGVGDFVNLFEPNATKLVKEGYGHIVGNIGAYSGEVPYTAFYSRKSYLENNKETLVNFTKAINKGLEYVKNHSSEEIAKIILPQFPDISLTDLTTIVDNYKKYDSWLSNSFITEESYKNLENIMMDAKLLENYVPYDQLINNLNNE